MFYALLHGKDLLWMKYSNECVTLKTILVKKIDCVLETIAIATKMRMGYDLKVKMLILDMILIMLIIK